MLVGNILRLSNSQEFARNLLVLVDHLNNVKRCGVCIYHKESLPKFTIL